MPLVVMLESDMEASPNHNYCSFLLVRLNTTTAILYNLPPPPPIAELAGSGGKIFACVHLEGSGYL